ncbi:hypothetical protein RJ639_019969 [Escallonia herrerae]|uniref:Non-specific lipid-transfer protein n=1 Tax=Escallonia herrerae TaxID=1293975 RepID=A0AA88V7C9_9ASTE|nr:hypothetical protein RJ639_019969 [Escallonia herrerae]
MAMLTKVACLMVLSMVVLAPYNEAAISCGQVASGVVYCLPYLRGTGKLLPQCCSGIRGLNTAARTPEDRKAACYCLQKASKSIGGLKPGLVAGLPGKCGVNIPYKISPSTDCSRVS